ncbi:MAG: DNA internalization-related competence protein ComEC/Rec2 [Marinobacterium sp.]|nr:DNA internalization-related competence protein ComEC/Rec2 [Marinobacterium sp.]
MIFYVAVIVMTGLLPVLPTVGALLLVAVMLLITGGLAASLCQCRPPGWLVWSVAGFLVAAGWGHWQLHHRIVDIDHKTDWQLRGTVTGLPEHQEGRLRFNFVPDAPAEKATLSASITSPDQMALHKLRRLRLSWYRPDQPLKPGMRLALTVRLAAPSGMSNPGGFDYPRWLLSRGIDATGYVRRLEVLGEKNCCFIDRARWQLNEWLVSRSDDPTVVATLQALLLGVKSGLDEQQWQILRHTGTVHLVVISGLHISFAALLGGWLGRRGSMLVRPTRQDHRPAMVWGALGLAFIYMLLSGSGLSAQRAMLMLAVFLLGWLWLHAFSHWRRWWLALAVVLSVSPLSFYEPGLWLSFTAVAILLAVGAVAQRGGNWWRSQLAIMLTMFPLLVAWFGGSSLLAPLINLIAIPFTGLLLLFALLALLLSGLFQLDILLPLLSGLIERCWWVLAQVAELPLAYMQITTPPLWAVVLAMSGAGLLLLPSGFSGRILAPVLWLPLLFGAQSLQSKPPFEAWLFDVGQGLALYSRSEGSTGESYHLIYDTGARYRSGSSAFQYAMQPALQRWQLDKVDLLILSHGDNDHAGGRAQLLAQWPVSERLTGSRRLVKQEGYTACRAGQQWQWGQTRLQMLAGSQGW